MAERHIIRCDECDKVEEIPREGNVPLVPDGWIKAAYIQVYLVGLSFCSWACVERFAAKEHIKEAKAPEAVKPS